MEQIPSYNPKEVEETVDQFWNKNEVYKRAKDKNKNKQKFYYLDGPPYTSGKIHIGHAWGKSLRDMLMRYKRMKGFDVWDRTGFDMHGLPISHKVEAKLGIKGKEAIEKHGVEDFIKECKSLAIENMNSMIVDFKKLGIWMDFDNPYKPIDNSYIEGIWWLIKKAHENNRLYEGKRTLTWCPSCETSTAKHELEYADIKDTSIFVKFKVKDTEKSKISGTTVSGSDDYLVIWTTTPWTIPFNLAIMVNPNVDYIKIKVKGENWIVAKELADSLVKDLLDEEYEILEEFKGETLEGMKYEHFFSKHIDYPEAEKMHTVLLSSEYVDTTAGSGLVHCAPGCGPEDYEVGHKNGLPAFNNVNEQGIFENMGRFDGLKAKFEDKIFIEEIEDAGALVASTKISHEYPHCERCHNPIVFRSTKQWFFKVEDLKEEMKTLNKDIDWVPGWAGNKQFHSWLDNLRDNSITKQIHWGTPFPVWKCESCTEYTVIGSSKELKELSGSCPEDLHKPFIDNVKIPCKCGKEQVRTPDVLDVWVDAGSASWLCLDYPVRTDLFEEMFPADFILEGKDQIRGWFNLLFVASMVSMKKPSFKAAYMHGFINDSSGRKMSKSLGNVISPSEITDKYGADTLRYYMIGAANPGLDMNYNFEDLTVKFKNISIFWNVHKYVIDTSSALNINPTKLDEKKVKLSVEENYILSKLNSTIKNMTEHLDKYELNQIPDLVEELFLELSRTYIQLVRDKLTIGDEEEKISALYTMNKVLTEGIKMFAIISPYVSEAMYQNLKEEFEMTEDSIHFFSWPEYDKNMINKE
jgi:isoleucyl-tRNA synthetase